ncbi:MAG TPA: PilN domain-containing protein [Thermodesulfobacteriota bacterium]|nr:PilN domain-containing protein [Thermodesulfobacteriota bacterium]
MIKINLLPVEEKREIKGLGEFVVGVLVLLAVVMLLIALNLIQNKRITNVNDRIADTKRKIQKLEDVKKKVEEFKAKNQELEGRIKAIAILEENRTGPLYVMDSLSQAIPDRAWIDKFSEKGSVAQMDGIAWDERTVADFMKRLQSSPYYQNVELKVIKAKDIQNLALKNFVIESKLNYSGKVVKEEQNPEANGLSKEKRK